MAVDTAKINMRYKIYYGKYLARECRPAASGRGLCDIDSIIQSNTITCQKIEKSV